MAKDLILITEAELDTLEAFLISDQVSETALDLIGAHGLLCALNIAPTRTPQSEWMALIFDGEPQWQSPEQRTEIETLLTKLDSTVSNDLSADQEVPLPFELTLEVEDEDETADVTIWSEAFMEGVFLNEADWFEPDEETVAGLLLPIMVASELFDDPEIQEIRKDRALSEEMCDQIPEVLIDLYLLYHAPEK
ncbi:MAG TPA: YecA family protein [Marinobacterium sp.]|nr:YecA family protein [Marinobacterium sp.]